jgi:hypothetical protein
MGHIPLLPALPIDYAHQCFGSVMFGYGYGSGSADPYLWSAAPDSALLSSGLPDANKKRLFLFIFKDKKLLRSLKTVEIKVFFLHFFKVFLHLFACT